LASREAALALRPCSRNTADPCCFSYEFFADLFANGLFAHLFRRLAPAGPAQQEVDDAQALESSVSQHQLTLLKLLDAFLHSQPGRYLADTGLAGSEGDLLVLVSSFIQLAQSAEASMKLILSTASAPPSSASEARAEQLILHEQTLVAQHEALLLHLQCLQYLVLLDGDRVTDVRAPDEAHASPSLVGAAKDATEAMRQRADFIQRVVCECHGRTLRKHC
jgi:hypothetical protein